ncbi:MAG: FKBP-type peptidyl-prolyl cis-trans isomerase [Myxococcales bacterium]|nr:FKBP-type peptidyl-prolyl cis-trans isomerase [Myxococcales bacterium]
MFAHRVSLFAVTFALLACEAEGQAQAETKQSAASASGSAPAAAAGGVFDPDNPPAGWIKCHKNHCHHQDGRVASYSQVMQENGLTSIKGGAAPQAAPAAPSDVAAPPADAEKTASGLASKVLKAGLGTVNPTATSKVSVHYTGWTTDGKSFDSSIPRGKPAQFPLNRVIPGWTEGLALMVVGEERRFWIPENLAYQGKPGKPAGMLVFDVELIEILD